MVKKERIIDFLKLSFFLSFLLGSLILIPNTPAALAAERNWTYQIREPVFSPITVANNMVYVGTDEGNLYVISETSGNVKWRFQSGEKSRATPVVSFGTVYLASNSGKLWALDAFTGRLKWSYQTGNPAVPAGAVYAYVQPAISEDLVYIGFNDGTLRAVNITSGQEVWSYDTKSTFVSSPFVLEDRVCVGTNTGQVLALNRKDGSLLWSYNTESTGVSTPFVLENRVYAGTNAGQIASLGIANGKSIWQRQIGENEITFVRATKERIYVISSNGNVYAFRPQGKLIWRYDTGASFLSPLILRDKALFAGSNEGYLYSFDALTGRPLWAYAPGGLIVTSVAFSDQAGYMVVNTKRGEAYTAIIMSFPRDWKPAANIKPSAGVVVGRQEDVTTLPRIWNPNESVKLGIIGGSANPFIRWLMDYIILSAGDTFSPRTSRAPTPALRVLSWPAGYPLSLLEYAAKERSPLLRFPSSLNWLDRFSAAAAVPVFLFALLFGPAALSWLLAVFIVIWLIVGSYHWIYRGAIGLWSANRSERNAQRRRRHFFKVLKGGLSFFTDGYPLVIVNLSVFIVFILFGLTAGVIFYPRPDILTFFLVVSSLWLLVLVGGSFLRGIGLLFISQQGSPWARLSSALRTAWRFFNRLLAFSLWNTFLITAILFTLALAQSYRLSFVLFFVLTEIVLLACTLFADLFIVSENRSFSKSLVRSLEFILNNPRLAGSMLLFQVSVLILLGLGLLVLGRWGLLVVPLLSAPLAGYLTEIQTRATLWGRGDFVPQSFEKK
jgi:outer membrane protein assembly factor BamB